MAKKPSKHSPLTQEQETVLRLLANFITFWKQRRDYYFKGAMQESLNKGKHDELRAEFSKYQIEYDTEVFPVFFARLEGFVHLWAGRKAAVDTVKDYQKRMRPYHSAVRLLTQPDAPLPEDAKVRLKGWPPPVPTLKNALLREVQQHIERDQGIKILDPNIEKASGKHPVWRQLQVELFHLLREHGLSKRRSYSLIAHLLQTLLPRWFSPPEYTHLEDSIRLNVKRHL